ncbi:VOC family protein [Sphingopyxis sp. Root1497]|uniref:VOC family protein n=1 Tax=Sphingopyxis sp. Root1497 TaxID=1736474 RepID=UPI0009EBDC67|nr:VOC family protein [Sphingopyxis sp. Root1497]
MSAAPPPVAKKGDGISPAKLAHIVLRTTDIDRMAAWYCDVLQAQIVLATDFIAFLTYDDEHHRIAIAQLPDLVERPAMAVGLEHIAFTYASPDHLFSTYERLKGDGLRPYWTINHGPTLSFYYRDPDLNQIELQIDLQDDAEAVNRWFAQSDFSVNPIGVRVDPDDMIARYRAGEDPGALFARPVISPDQIPAQFPPAPDEARGEGRDISSKSGSS